MKKPISICGIETNNLKNIDIQIKRNALNLIIDPSGSGKSSLDLNKIIDYDTPGFVQIKALITKRPFVSL